MVRPNGVRLLPYTERQGAVHRHEPRIAGPAIIPLTALDQFVTVLNFDYCEKKPLVFIIIPARRRVSFVTLPVSIGWLQLVPCQECPETP